MNVEQPAGGHVSVDTDEGLPAAADIVIDEVIFRIHHGMDTSARSVDRIPDVNIAAIPRHIRIVHGDQTERVLGVVLDGAVDVVVPQVFVILGVIVKLVGNRDVSFGNNGDLGAGFFKPHGIGHRRMDVEIPVHIVHFFVSVLFYIQIHGIGLRSRIADFAAGIRVVVGVVGRVLQEIVIHPNGMPAWGTMASGGITGMGYVDGLRMKICSGSSSSMIVTPLAL